MTAKFGLERKSFMGALDTLLKVVPSSNSTPILRNFLVEARSNSIRISATDKSVTRMITLTEVVVVPETGNLILPAKEILEIVHKASGSLIAVGVHETQEDTVSVACGPTRWNLRTLRLDNYPLPVDLVSTEIHSLSRSNLLEALLSVRRAMATKSFDPSLEQISIRAGKVTAANSIWFQEFDLGEGIDVNFAVPGAVISDLVSLLSNPSHEAVEVGLSASGAEMVFQVGSDVLSTHTMVKVFPDMAKFFLVPAMANNEVLRVDRKALIDAVSRVRITSDPSTAAVVLDLSREEYRSVQVSAKARNGASSTESLDVEWTGGSRRAIFHHEYLLDLLASFDSDVVQLKFGPDQSHKPSTVLIQSERRTGVLNQLRADMV